MNSLELNTKTKSFLTNEDKDGAFVCDLKGKRLDPSAAPIPVYRDLYTGDVYAKLAEVIPSASDVTSKAAAKAITDLEPIHFVSEDGSVKGWFVKVADFQTFAAPQA